MSFEISSRSDQELQRTMYIAVELLGTLKRCRRDLRQLAQIEKGILAVTDRLEYLIQGCEYTLVGRAAQTAGLYNLASRLRCPDCMQRAINSQRQSKPAETTVLPPPISQPALEFAIACTRSVANEFLRSHGPGTPESFPLCLARLRSALRRLQELSPTTTQGAKLQVEKPSDNCADCGKPIEAEVGQK